MDGLDGRDGRGRTWTDVDGRGQDGRGRTGRTWTDGTDVDGRDGHFLTIKRKLIVSIGQRIFGGKCEYSNKTNENRYCQDFRTASFLTIKPDLIVRKKDLI